MRVWRVMVVLGIMLSVGSLAYLCYTHRRASSGLLTVLVPAGMLIALFGVFIRNGLEEGFRELVLKEGVPAQAKILEAHTLGFNKSTGKTRIKLVLEMQPPDRPAYQAECIFRIAVADAKLLYPPGEIVKAFYDPKYPRHVAVPDAELRLR